VMKGQPGIIMYGAGFSIAGCPEYSVCAEAAVFDGHMAVRVDAGKIAEGSDGAEGERGWRQK
jgi:hypothetical protein